MNSEAKLRRRTFLKALSLGLSAPLALSFARMATAQAGARPKRLLIYYMPHGVPNEHMDMQPYLTAGGEFKDFGQNPDAPLPGVHVNTEYTFETRSGRNLLRPLEPYRNMMHVVRGLHQAGSFDTHNSIGAILTGNGSGPSVDQLLAQELGASSMFIGAVPRMGNTLDGSNGVLVRDNSDWVSPVGDVVALNDQLFGDVQENPNPMADLSAEFRADSLNLTIEEISALRQEVSGLTQTDTKLAAHLTALERLKSAGSGLGPVTGEACNAAPVIPHLDVFKSADNGKQEWEPRYWQEAQHFEKIAEAQAELAGYAVLCGHTRILTLQNMWASADIPLPGVLTERPTASHHVGISHQGLSGSSTDPMRLDFANPMRLDFATAQEWFMGHVARICQILDQPDPFDPDHTALENSLIYVCSEIADGNDHGKSLKRIWTTGGGEDVLQYYPAIILGGGGGALKPGSLITVDNRPIADLLLTIAKAMGSSVTSFGGSGTTPFTEILA